MPTDRQEASIRLLLVLGLIAVAVRLCSLAWLHPLGWDEIEFFRAADWVRQGLVPYRDFWEHHTPLQWFLFAPVTALVKSPGADAIIAMRWAQIPLWIATFWAISTWMRDEGIARWTRWTVIVIALCSSLLMLAAVEFRVDVLGTLLYLLGLVLLNRVDRGARFAFAAGVLFCLAGFANLRLGPLLALTVLLARIVRPKEARWEGNRRINWTYAGVIATFALASVYFVATHSARIAFQRLWVENFLGDRAVQAVAWQFVYRLGSPFGLRPLEARTMPWFVLSSVDPSAIVILVVGGIGVGRALWRNRRTPDSWFFLAFLQVSNILFIAAMKFVYLYHLQIVVILMLPFVARELERFLAVDGRRRAVVIAFLFLVTIINAGVSLFRGKEADHEYQDTVMREVDRRTAPGSKVFDGVGWALRRKPAYEYWFLPALAKVHERARIFRPYRAAEMAQDPPAAVITDFRTCWWIAEHRELRAFVGKHYLPSWRDLWLPGLSARLTPVARVAQWVVPASGDYRIYSSIGLATHPWFLDPLTVGTYSSPDAGQLTVDLRRLPPPHDLSWTVGGKPIVPDNGVLHLRRTEVVAVLSSSPAPLGVFVVPTYETELFRQPPPGVTIDGFAPPETHVPDFRKLAAAFGLGQ